MEDRVEYWQQQYRRLRARLLAALKPIPDGGILETLEHVGATSIPGVPGAPCVDIALAAWPLPLAARHYATLLALGYAIVPGFDTGPEWRFQHADGGSQLLVVEAGSDRWLDLLALRDYLRADAGARQAYAAGKQDAAARPGLFDRLLVQARAWWTDAHGFAPVEAVAREFAGFAGLWHVASGWALDLYVGRVTRMHHDVVIAVARDDQLGLQQHMVARGWQLMAPNEGRAEPWPPLMWLELPRHQVHAYRDDAFIDCLLTDVVHGLWTCRRNPSVTRTVERAGMRTAAGVPFLAPELVLLYKSQNTSGRARPQDQRDFDAVCPHLEHERRAWLRWAITVSEPEHPWLQRLT